MYGADIRFWPTLHTRLNRPSHSRLIPCLLFHTPLFHAPARSLDPHAAGYTLLALAIAPLGPGISNVPPLERGPSPRRGIAPGAAPPGTGAGE